MSEKSRATIRSVPLLAVVLSAGGSQPATTGSIRLYPPSARSAVRGGAECQAGGYNDLQGRTALVVTTKSDPANGNWVYVGHHESFRDGKPLLNPITGKMEFNGTSILEISDPSKPATGLAHSQRDEQEFARRIGGLRLQVRFVGTRLPDPELRDADRRAKPDTT